MTDTQADNEQLVDHPLRYLQGFLNAGALDAQAVKESSHGDTITLAITGPEARLLVGPHGQTLDALQYLLSLMTNKGSAQRLRITVDADGYRARRAQTLTDFAQELAAQVAKSGQEAITDPLNAMDRRIIHTALSDHMDVETYSEGDDPNRYVVISPRTTSKET